MKPDWGVLQQQFLAEHSVTGISPKEWCEIQGLNYATARRYIKKPTVQSVQKTAQKKVRTAQKKNAQMNRCAIVIYRMRRVTNLTMRRMMKVSSACAITGSTICRHVSSLSILST